MDERPGAAARSPFRLGRPLMGMAAGLFAGLSLESLQLLWCHGVSPHWGWEGLWAPFGLAGSGRLVAGTLLGLAYALAFKRGNWRVGLLFGLGTWMVTAFMPGLERASLASLGGDLAFGSLLGLVNGHWQRTQGGGSKIVFFEDYAGRRRQRR